MEIQKKEVAFASIAKGKLQTKDVVHVTIAELRSKLIMFMIQVRSNDSWIFKLSMLEEKMEHIMLGETLHANAKMG